MATVNKASLRTEFGALKARFEALCANGKMSPESRAAPTRVVAETRTAPVTECRACGRGLEGVAPAGHERRRLVDLVFETRESTVKAEIKTCPRCRTENRGAFPKEMPGPLTYGPGIVAFAVHLLSAQMVSLKRTAQTLKALTGRAIAEATLLAWLRRLHEALADWGSRRLGTPADQARAARGRNLPAHRAQKPLAAQLRRRRPDAQVRASKARSRRHRRTQRHPPLRRHPDPRPLGQLLHLQELQTRPVRQPSVARPRFVEDAHGHAWAKRLKKLLLDTCRSVREHPDKALGEAACKAVRKRYRTLLTQARRELPKPPKRLSGQRGRIARSDAENLHEALVQYETEVLRFARDPNVPFTNNRAERDIRMAKVKQKVSGCFRTPRYAAAYCRISSYLQSMAYQGYNPLTAIQIALNGNAATMIGNPTDQAPGGE